MKSYKINSVTIDELNQWKNNSLINPRTKRGITNTGNLFKYLNKEYIKYTNTLNKDLTILNKDNIIIEKKEENIFNEKKEENIFINIYKLEESVDDKDPISFVRFWILENGEKKIIYSDLNNLILYKDSHNLIRCFEKKSLSYLKAYNITKHPINGDEIPENILKLCQDINLLEERKNKTISEKAFDVFQKFSKISLFGINYELFINLDKNQLIKFNYELREFYLKNLNEEQQSKITNKTLLKKKQNELNVLSKEQIIEYLLNEIDTLLNVETEGLLYMIKSILIGALQLVIPEIKNEYSEDLLFDF